MNDKPYAVYIVVDPQFGSRLGEIPDGEPIWIVDTPTNRFAFEAVWKERHNEGHLVGVTSFKVDPQGSAEDWLLSDLDTIDLHHGELSHIPPWSVIRVIGATWTKRIQEGLASFGFARHEDTPDGFVAWRDADQDTISEAEGSRQLTNSGQPQNVRPGESGGG